MKVLCANGNTYTQYYTTLQYKQAARPGDMSTDSGSSNSGAAEHFEAFLGSMTRMFTEFKRELMQEQEHVNKRLTKCIRLEKPPTLRKKKHEKQFQFNEEEKEKVVALL